MLWELVWLKQTGKSAIAAGIIPHTLANQQNIRCCAKDASQLWLENFELTALAHPALIPSWQAHNLALLVVDS